MIAIPRDFDTLRLAGFLISKISIVLPPVLDAGLDATCVGAVVDFLETLLEMLRLPRMAVRHCQQSLHVILGSICVSECVTLRRQDSASDTHRLHVM